MGLACVPAWDVERLVQHKMYCQLQPEVKSNQNLFHFRPAGVSFLCLPSILSEKVIKNQADKMLSLIFGWLSLWLHSCTLFSEEVVDKGQINESDCNLQLFVHYPCYCFSCMHDSQTYKAKGRAEVQV